MLVPHPERLSSVTTNDFIAARKFLRFSPISMGIKSTKITPIAIALIMEILAFGVDVFHVEL